MALFSGNKQTKALIAVIAKHAAALGELQKAQALLNSKFRNLEMEWVNSFEKLKSISGRIAKRQALDGIEPPEPAPEPGNGETEPDPYAGLDPVSARIMRRRGVSRRT